MPTFRPSEQAVAMALRQVLARALPIMIVCFTLPIVFLSDRMFLRSTFYFVIPILGAILAVSIWRARKQLRESLSSYVLILNDDTLTRKQQGLADICIYRDNVTTIVEHPIGGLGVRTHDSKQSIGIPRWLDDYYEVRDHLSSWSPITAKSYPLLLLFLAPTFVMLALFVGLFQTTYKVVSIASGVVLLGGLSGCFIYLRNHPHVDDRVKKNLWAMVIALLFIAVRLYVSFL